MIVATKKNDPVAIFWNGFCINTLAVRERFIDARQSESKIIVEAGSDYEGFCYGDLYLILQLDIFRTTSEIIMFQKVVAKLLVAFLVQDFLFQMAL